LRCSAMQRSAVILKQSCGNYYPNKHLCMAFYCCSYRTKLLSERKSSFIFNTLLPLFGNHYSFYPNGSFFSFQITTRFQDNELSSPSFPVQLFSSVVC
ncbi:hypothetical protein T4C_1124, partial [Trichinella pseudospiralis]